MFGFFKIIKIFFMPLGFIFVLFLTGLALLFFKQREKLPRLGKKILFFAILIFYSFSIEPVSRFLALGLEKKYNPILKNDIDAKAIVILSSGQFENPDLPAQLQLEKTGLVRTLEGYRLWKLYKQKIFLVVSGGSGQPFRKETPMAITMKKFLMEMGVPESLILIEPKSRDTYENILFTEQILEKKGIYPVKHKIILVTSGLHLWRSALLAKKRMWNFIPSPSDFSASEKEFNLLSFLPSAYDLQLSTEAIHEYIGIVFYMLRGRI